MTSKIDPALQEQLHVPGDWPLNIEVQFSQAPPPQELDALGLQHEGLNAWGALNRQRIEALANIPQVVSIRLSQRAVPETAPQPAQIGARLQMEMAGENPNQFLVTVRFRGTVPSPSEFPELSIHLDVGTGTLTREQIQKLARRNDVVSIDSNPPVKLL